MKPGESRLTCDYIRHVDETAVWKQLWLNNGDVAVDVRSQYHVARIPLQLIRKANTRLRAYSGKIFTI